MDEQIGGKVQILEVEKEGDRRTEAEVDRQANRQRRANIQTHPQHIITVFRTLTMMGRLNREKYYRHASDVRTLKKPKIRSRKTFLRGCVCVGGAGGHAG